MQRKSWYEEQNETAKDTVKNMEEETADFRITSAPPELLPSVDPVEKTSLSPTDIATLLGPQSLPDVPDIPGTAGVFDPYIPEERDWSWTRPLDIPALDPFRTSATEFTGHFLGGVEDAAERLWNMTIPDEWIGREGKDPASFDRYEPTTTSGLFGRMAGTLFGILPAEKPFSAIELQKQPLWEQILMGAGMKIPTAPGLLGKGAVAAKGGVGGRSAFRIPTPNSPAVTKIMEAVKRAKKLKPEQEELYTIERGKKASAAARAIETATREAGGNAPTIEAVSESLKKLVGKMKIDFDNLVGNLNVKEIAELEELVFNASKVGRGSTAIRVGNLSTGIKQVDYYDYLNNMKALSKILDSTTDSLPTTGEIKRLERIFGSEMVDAIGNPQSGLRKAWLLALDTLNLPKALIATIDISAPGRQGWKLALSPFSKEWIKAFKVQFEMLDPFLGRQRFDQLMGSIQAHKHYEVAKRSGLFEGELATAYRNPSRGEEAYISRFVRKIPGIEISERAYTGFLNKLRFDVFYKQLDDWERAGYKYTEEDLKSLGQYVNWSTGRGGTGSGKWGRGIAEVLNATFFSPRFLTSGPLFYLYPFVSRPGIQKTGAPFGLGGGKAIPQIGLRNAAVSKIWASTLVGHVSKNMAILYGIKEMADAMGWDAEIGLNPRSSDFGKIRFGPVRWDFWGGDAQLAQFVARLILTHTPDKLQDPQNVIDLDTGSVLMRFVRGKMNPGLSSVWELGISKEDYFGNEIDLSDPEDLKEQARQRLLFMFAQDVIESTALEQSASVDPLWAAPGLFGAGVQIYNTVDDIKNEIALREHGVLFDELIEEPDGYTKQQQIKLSPAVQLFYSTRRAKKADDNPSQQFWNGMDTYNKRLHEITFGTNIDGTPSSREEGLKSKIVGGLEGLQVKDPQGAIYGTFGKYMDNAIMDFLDEKSQAYLANIPADIDEIMATRLYESGQLNEIFRDRYWSVPLETDPLTGIPDYEGREVKREEILTEGVQAGLYAGNITSRGDMSADPLINSVLTQWSDDQEYLRDNFYDKADEFIQSVGYWDSYQRWKYSGFSSLYRTIIPGFSEMLRTLQIYKHSMRLADPEIERILWRWGRIDATSIKSEGVLTEEQVGKGVESVLEALITIQQ